MAVSILYFAWVREGAGIEGESINIPKHIISLGDLADWLALRHSVLADKAKIRGAIDQRMAGMDAAIAGATEIAFSPPVTGG